MTAPPRRSAPSSSSFVTQRSLSCLSSNSRVCHSLNRDDDDSSFSIVSHILPITDDTVAIETPLPTRVSTELRSDPARGLILASSSSSSSSPSLGSDHRAAHDATVLALYAARSLWVLTLRLPRESDSAQIHHDKRTTGTVVRVEEPFEEVLLATSGRIVRVRAPPSCCALVPPGSVAMMTDEGTLACAHRVARRRTGGRYGLDEDEDEEMGVATASCYRTTTPAYWGSTDSFHKNPVMDFCLGASDDAGMFDLYVLRRSGAVYGARPVIFDGTAAPRQEVTALLSQEEEQDNRDDNARSRRLRAERRFVRDTFNDDDSGGRYATARARGASAWPVRVRGPITTNSDPEDKRSSSFAAHTIESHRAAIPVDLGGGTMPVLVVARSAAAEPDVTFIDVRVLPRPLDARFGLETEEDAEELDCDYGRGIVLETVRFDDKGGRTSDGGGETSSSLIVETVPGREDDDAELVVHVASSRGVFTLSTSILGATFAEMRSGDEGAGEESPDATSARSILAVGPGAALEGLVVSTDAALGHVLVARLDNGDVEAVNLTAERWLFAAANRNDEKNMLRLSSSSTSPDRLLDAVPPFLTTVAPLVDRLRKGVAASSGKLVGRAVLPCNAGPQETALVHHAVNALRTEVAAPLVELRDATNRHREVLAKILASQTTQLEALHRDVEEVRTRREALSNLSDAEHSAAAIARRSAAVLDVARAVRAAGAVTAAEREHARRIAELERRAERWETAAAQAAARGNDENDESQGNAPFSQRRTCAVRLTLEQAEACRALARGTDDAAQRGRASLQSAEERLQALAEEHGATLTTEELMMRRGVSREEDEREVDRRRSNTEW